MQVEFIPVVNESEIKKIVDLANIIWNEYYVPIIGQPHVDYMLDKFQSAKAIENQIEIDGYKYFLINFGETMIGYLSVQQRGFELFLSKFYLLKEYRGLGKGRAGMDFLVRMCQKMRLKAITLTVNKDNTQSILAYEKLGFNVYDAKVTQIGEGYIMDDYFMRLSVENYASKS